MTSTSQKIRFFRQHIPTFACTPGCHDCCGPVTTSSEEMSRLPVLSEQAHAVALAEYNCPHLGAHGCTVYAERPLICRLFGTTSSLSCPNGQRPAQMTDPKIEREIHRYLASSRQVLV